MSELSRWVIIDDRDSRIQYTSGWSDDSGDSHNSHGNFGQVYSNTLKTTTAANNGGFTFTFTGDEARIYGTNNPNYKSSTDFDPDWECTLDGSVSSPAKAKPFQYRENHWVFCSFNRLSPGEHTIGLNAKGKSRPFHFDFIRYRPTGAVSGETVFVTRDDSDIVYSSGRPQWAPLAEVAYFTNTPGESVTFPFVGTALSLWAMAPTERGHASSAGAYSIDGGDTIPFTIPSVGGVSEYNRKIFETALLPHGYHTVEITYRGSPSSTPLVLSNFLITNGSNARAVLASSNPPPSSTPPPSTGTGNADSNDDGTGSEDSGSGNGGSSNSKANEGGTSNNINIGNNDDENGSTGSNTVNVEGNHSDDNSSDNKGSSDSQTGVGRGTTNTVYYKPGESGSDSNGGNIGGTATENLDADSTPSTKSKPTGPIVGGVLGALAIILLGVGAILYLRRRKRRADSYNNNTPSMSFHDSWSPQRGAQGYYGATGTGTVGTDAAAAAYTQTGAGAAGAARAAGLHPDQVERMAGYTYPDPGHQRGGHWGHTPMVSQSSSTGLSYARSQQTDHGTTSGGGSSYNGHGGGGHARNRSLPASDSAAALSSSTHTDADARQIQENPFASSRDQAPPPY